MSIELAAFIMTYHREDILLKTIIKIKAQTLSPKLILIVDNSENNRTEKKIKSLNDSSIFYHKVGYNSGPAGAAAIGLKILAEKGFDWIYWGDDDDPPSDDHVFERLLSYTYPQDTGAIGLVGQYFNIKKAEIVRVPDEALEGDGIIAVDNIAGGMTKMVKGDAIRKFQIYPEEKLFFGFEELDFDLKLKQKGLKLYCPKKEYYEKRKEHGRLKYNRKVSFKAVNMVRNYYSYRNLLFITFHHKMYLGMLVLMIKLFAKSIFGFSAGLGAGFQNLKCNTLAIFHFISGKFGRQF